MKLEDLLEQQKVIKGSIEIRPSATKLEYEGFIVRGSFYCFNTAITSLAGAPKEVGGIFNCNNTRIHSLKGAPNKVGSHFYCSRTNINSLEGAPSYVGGDIDCYNTFLPSLHNIHKQIKHIGEGLYLPDRVKSHILGVMYIKKLRWIVIVNGDREQEQATTIINKHLNNGRRSVHEAQEELLEAGLTEYAKL